MSAMRSRRRSRLTRASARASGAPTQVWMPNPNPRCWRPVGAVEAELGRLTRTGAGHGWPRRCAPSRVVPAGMSTPPTWSRRRVTAGTRPGCGLSSRSISSMKPGMRSRSSRSSCWSSGRSAISWSIEPRSRAVVSPPAENRLAAISSDVVDLGHRPVGKRSRSPAGHDVVARLAPALLDVGGEPVVEELQRLVRDGAARRSRRCGRRACPGARLGTPSWSASGTPSRSAMTSSVKGFA